MVTRWISRQGSMGAVHKERTNAEAEATPSKQHRRLRMQIDGNGVWYDPDGNIRYSACFILRCYQMFRGGLTTRDIAGVYRKPEWIIYNALARRVSNVPNA